MVTVHVSSILSCIIMKSLLNSGNNLKVKILKIITELKSTFIFIYAKFTINDTRLLSRHI